MGISIEDMQVWSEGQEEPCDNSGACFQKSWDFYGGLETSGELWDHNLFTKYTVFFDWVDSQPINHKYYPLRKCVKALYKSRVEGSQNSTKYNATTRAWSFKMKFATRDLQNVGTVITLACVRTTHMFGAAITIMAQSSPVAG